MDGIEQILQHFLIKAAFKISLKYETRTITDPWSVCSSDTL